MFTVKAQFIPVSLSTVPVSVNVPAVLSIVLAEPNAYIGFAGARLIEGALKVKLPSGFQRAEYQFGNGFIDKVVPRKEFKAFLGKLLQYLAPESAIGPPPEPEPEEEPEPAAAAAAAGE